MNRESIYQEARQSDDSLRWLAASGPMYVDQEFFLAEIHFELDDLADDWATLIGSDGKSLEVTARNVSLASWATIMGAPMGSLVAIKIRTDHVGRPKH